MTDDHDFKSKLLLSSVPLRRIDDSKRPPTGFASGCLVDYLGKRVLLTVSHATQDQGNWTIQLRYVPAKGTELYGLGTMNFLAKSSLSEPKLQDIDFAYVEVPNDLQAWSQEIESPGNYIKKQTPNAVHSTSFNDVPQLGVSYGFCGTVLPTWETHFGQNYLGSEIRAYTGLSFLRTQDDLHYFSLPFKHPGHEQFKGCSGAPILSNTGALVGLLCGGNLSTNEIYGVSLRSYKTAIDIHVGNIE